MAKIVLGMWTTHGPTPGIWRDTAGHRCVIIGWLLVHLTSTRSPSPANSSVCLRPSRMARLRTLLAIFVSKIT